MPNTTIQEDKNKKQNFGQQWHLQLIILRLFGISLLIIILKLQFYNWKYYPKYVIYVPP
jgi:hypothetical protein